jgi:hypothetical protein
MDERADLVLARPDRGRAQIDDAFGCQFIRLDAAREIECGEQAVGAGEHDGSFLSEMTMWPEIRDAIKFAKALCCSGRTTVVRHCPEDASLPRPSGRDALQPI